MSILNKFFFILIVVMVGVLLYGKIFFDVNDYRDNISSYLSEKIGYEVTYKGTIEIDYEPSAKVTVTKIIIRDPLKNNTLIAEIEELELSINKEKVLNGIIDVERVEIMNMAFYGVDVDEVLMKSYTLIKELKYKEFNSQNYTIIKFMKAKAIIDNQQMMVDDINIVTSLLSINGNGIINLQSKKLNFNMIGSLRDKKDVIQVYQNNYPNEIYGNSIPVKITGPVDKVDFEVDLTDIITKQIINPIKEKLIDELNEKVFEQIKLPF